MKLKNYPPIKPSRIVAVVQDLLVPGVQFQQLQHPAGAGIRICGEQGLPVDRRAELRPESQRAGPGRGWFSVENRRPLGAEHRPAEPEGGVQGDGQRHTLCRRADPQFDLPRE